MHGLALKGGATGLKCIRKGDNVTRHGKDGAWECAEIGGENRDRKTRLRVER